MLTNLGIVHIITSRYAGAEELLGEAIAAYASGEPGSAAHATTLNALGTLLSRQGRHPEAIAMLQSATDIRMALFGELHPATSVALGNLGNAMEASGDPAGGEVYLMQALAIDEQVLGYEHPSVAVLLNQLAGTRRELGDPVGSITYLERALAILRQHEGEDGASPAIASLLSGLGAASLRLSEFDAAGDYFEQAIVIEERVLGPDSRELAVDLVQLGMVRLGQSRLEDAELLLRRGLEIFTGLLADDHVLIGNALPVVELEHWVTALAAGRSPPDLSIGGY